MWVELLAQLFPYVEGSARTYTQAIQTRQVSWEQRGKTERMVGVEHAKLLPNHKRILEESGAKVYIEDRAQSVTSRSTYDVHLRQEVYPGEYTHEIGHVIQNSRKLYEDPEFLEVLRNGIPAGTDFDVDWLSQAETELGNDATILNFPNSKFVSPYQGKIADVDFFGAGVRTETGDFNVLTLTEYFSEGFRAFYLEPDRLKVKDPALYGYILNLI